MQFIEGMQAIQGIIEEELEAGDEVIDEIEEEI